MGKETGENNFKIVRLGLKIVTIAHGPSCGRFLIRRRLLQLKNQFPATNVTSMLPHTETDVEAMIAFPILSCLRDMAPKRIVSALDGVFTV